MYCTFLWLNRFLNDGAPQPTHSIGKTFGMSFLFWLVHVFFSCVSHLGHESVHRVVLSVGSGTPKSVFG